jgi:hypothetical protein
MQGQWLLPHKEMNMKKTFFGLMAIAVLAFALTGCDNGGHNGGGYGPADEVGIEGGPFTGSISLTNVPAGVTVYITGNPEYLPWGWGDDVEANGKVNVNGGGTFSMEYGGRKYYIFNNDTDTLEFDFHLFIVKSLDLTPNSNSYSYARINTGIRKTKPVSDNNVNLGNIGSFRLPDLVTLSGTINASLNKFFPSAAIDWEDESEGIVSVYRQDREIYRDSGTGSSEAAWSLLVPASRSISLDCGIYSYEINSFALILSSTAYPVNTSNQNQTGIDIDMGDWISLEGRSGRQCWIEARAENNSVFGRDNTGSFHLGDTTKPWKIHIPASSSYHTVKFYTSSTSSSSSPFLDSGVSRSVSNSRVTGINLN